MNSRIPSLLILAGVALAGCSEPPDLIPVALPGTELKRAPPPTVGSGAEAIGEERGHSSTRGTLSTIISEPTPIGEVKKTASGLNYVTLKAGDGPIVKPGQRLKVHYVGRLENGTKFDSSIDRGAPLDVEIGAGRVIKGWDYGIPGMKVGEKRRLIIPPDLGYGASGYPPSIPANATLTFDVEVVEAR